jgi:hypothetical protein
MIGVGGKTELGTGTIRLAGTDDGITEAGTMTTDGWLVISTMLFQ